MNITDAVPIRTYAPLDKIEVTSKSVDFTSDGILAKRSVIVSLDTVTSIPRAIATALISYIEKKTNKLKRILQTTR